ncbi:MAG TPA: hypothetical protein VMB73_04660 [Acetobacteraceae bacterium]|jgi:hypothetical protein|nr:hypothetical protein [Acetobacteraceae bacterium]
MTDMVIRKTACAEMQESRAESPIEKIYRPGDLHGADSSLIKSPATSHDRVIG